MIFPPSIFRLRIVRPGRRKVRLFVPLFLLWPVVLAIVLVVTPLWLIRAVVRPWRRHNWRSVLTGPYLLYVFCRLRGLRVEVETKDESLLVAFL